MPARTQNSKRAREARKNSRALGLHKVQGKPSHIPGRDWARFQARYLEKTEMEFEERKEWYDGYLRANKEMRA